jgi:hypothetical protein
MAGLAYFGLVFLLGTILGTLRILLVEPRLGAAGSVLLELPFMLAASWFVCGILVRRFAVPPGPGDRLVMGAVAFLLLMAAELALSLYAVGGTVEGHFAAYRQPAQLLGLMGQLAFASFPLLRSRAGSPVGAAASGG